eukprot:3932157-Rhodomonas_salina.1
MPVPATGVSRLAARSLSRCLSVRLGSPLPALPVVREPSGTGGACAAEPPSSMAMSASAFSFCSAAPSPLSVRWSGTVCPVAARPRARLLTQALCRLTNVASAVMASAARCGVAASACAAGSCSSESMMMASSSAASVTPSIRPAAVSIGYPSSPSFSQADSSLSPESSARASPGTTGSLLRSTHSGSMLILSKASWMSCWDLGWHQSRSGPSMAS